jgi:hypothetical protein
MTVTSAAMRNRDPGSLRLLLLASLIPLLVASIAISATEPTIRSPYPGVQFLLLAFGWPRWLTVAIAPTLFVASIVNVAFAGSRGRLLHVALPMGFLTALSGIYFWVRLPEGLDHQGVVYSAAMVGANALGLLAFWSAWILWRRSLTATRSICLALLACCWLFWCGFPYFGEGI